MSDKIKRKVKSTSSNATSFLETVVKNKKESLAKYVKKGIDINSRDAATGETALHISIDLGYTDLLGELLNLGADINATANDGQTPLHRAAAKGMQSVVQQLLTAKANVNITDNEGKTPLFLSLNVGNDKLINLLIENGASLDTVDKAGNTLAHEAAGYNFLKNFLQTLIKDKDVDVNQQNLAGNSALHIAAEKGTTANINLLLGLFADPFLKNKNQETPGDVAAKASYPSHEKVAELLRKPRLSVTGTNSSRIAETRYVNIADLPPFPPPPEIPKESFSADELPSEREIPPPYIPSPDIRSRLSGRFDNIHIPSAASNTSNSSPRERNASSPSGGGTPRSGDSSEGESPAPPRRSPSFTNTGPLIRKGSDSALPPPRNMTISTVKAPPARPPPGPPPGPPAGVPPLNPQVPNSGPTVSPRADVHGTPNVQGPPSKGPPREMPKIPPRGVPPGGIGTGSLPASGRTPPMRGAAPRAPLERGGSFGPGNMPQRAIPVVRPPPGPPPQPPV